MQKGRSERNWKPEKLFGCESERRNATKLGHVNIRMKIKYQWNEEISVKKERAFKENKRKEDERTKAKEKLMRVIVCIQII